MDMDVDTPQAFGFMTSHVSISSVPTVMETWAGRCARAVCVKPGLHRPRCDPPSQHAARAEPP